jgi:hypothetical protein
LLNRLSSRALPTEAILEPIGTTTLDQPTEAPVITPVAPLEPPAESAPLPDATGATTEQAPIVPDAEATAPESVVPVESGQPVERAQTVEQAQTVEATSSLESTPPVEQAQPVKRDAPSTSAPTLDLPEQAPASNGKPANAEPTNAAIPEATNATTPEPPINAVMVDMMAGMDGDAALAAALTMSAGDAGLDLAALGMGDIGGMGGMGDMGLGGMGGMAGMAGMGQENLEEQLLACRCVANLMEAMPGSAHTLVYHGAIPVSCNKLLHITFIDLAEQTISVCPFIPQ